MITQIEDSLITLVDATLGNTIREKDTLPGGWTLDMLKRALQFAPGVYVGFSGLTLATIQDCFDGNFVVYAVTKGTTDKQRRKGNTREIGAYEIVEKLLPKLITHSINNIGCVTVQAVDNLFRDALFDLGGTVYGIRLKVDNLNFPIEIDQDELDAFITFAADYDLDPSQEHEPLAQDLVILPQE